MLTGLTTPPSLHSSLFPFSPQSLFPLPLRVGEPSSDILSATAFIDELNKQFMQSKETLIGGHPPLPPPTDDQRLSPPPPSFDRLPPPPPHHAPPPGNWMSAPPTNYHLPPPPLPQRFDNVWLRLPCILINFLSVVDGPIDGPLLAISRTILLLLLLLPMIFSLPLLEVTPLDRLPQGMVPTPHPVDHGHLLITPETEALLSGTRGGGVRLEVGEEIVVLL